MITTRQIGLGAVATVLLSAVSTLTVAAAAGGVGDHVRLAGAAAGRFADRPPLGCSSPALPGTVVDAALIDMNGMGAMMGLGGNGMGTMMGWGARGSGPWHPAMLRIALTTAQAPAGQVSLRVTNLGVITHEVIVLPLTAGQSVGNRVVGSDGKIDETGSLGEVSASCAADAGDGLAPGSTGWTTLHLSPGRYELACNLPGHYAAGMYTEFDIT